MLRANQHTYPSYGYHPYTYPFYQNAYWNFYPQSGPAPVYPSIPLPNLYYHNRDTSYPVSNSNTLETTLLGLQSLKSHSELVNEFCGTLTHFFNQTSPGRTDGPTPVNEVKALWIQVLAQRFRILSKCDDCLDRPAALRAISDYIFGEHRECMVVDFRFGVISYFVLIMVADDLVSEGEAKYNQPQLNSETTINDSDVQLENEYKQLSSLQNDMGLVRTFFHATKVYLSLNDAGTLILSR
ncbi:hypothetical protein BCR33DRAFT_859804 [Rhizoclosmatium globosum]|uniref:Uncharacterized protein n=1 Tax=Rhizoclosmatium globosum TaxID=329046 RepID=A0A1Y2ASD6_9FUNG|nr:hypothetical protein BCR33DRAFT_859804 [Rhizoclosmatium globosum]|eukprot:ORY25488.1 hypothetical protein BCR33DRAFT_859804 [Rhizoclosmatium globosum]